MSGALSHLLTEQEAAARVRLCGKSLGNARRRGEVRYVQLGRKVFYTEADLAEFVASRNLLAQPALPTPPRGRRRPPGNVVVGRFSERRA